MILVSFASVDDIASVLIADKGTEIYKHTYKVLDISNEDSKYLCLLDAMKKSIGFLKVYLEDKNTDDSVVFETCNGNLVKWFNKGYPREQCRNEFFEVFELLDELPVRFSIRTVKKPYAKLYLSEKYIAKPKLSNFDDWGDEEC